MGLQSFVYFFWPLVSQKAGRWVGNRAAKQFGQSPDLALYMVTAANTENAARIIWGLTGADMLKVEPLTPFLELDTGAFIAWGRKQLEKQAWPEMRLGLSNKY